MKTVLLLLFIFAAYCNAVVSVTGANSGELVITSTVGTQDCQLRMQRGGDWVEPLKVCHLSGGVILEYKIRVFGVVEFVDTAGNGYQRTDPIVQNLGFTQSFGNWLLYEPTKYSLTSPITALNGTIDFSINTLTHAADAYWSKFNYQAVRQNPNSKLAVRTELVSIRKLGGANVQATGTVAQILEQLGNPMNIAYNNLGQPVSMNLTDIEQTQATPDIKYTVWFTINWTSNLNFNGIPLIKFSTPDPVTTGSPVVTTSALTSGSLTTSPLTTSPLTTSPLTTGFDCSDPNFLNQLQYCGYTN